MFLERGELQWRLRRGNDKVIGEGRGTRDIEQCDVERLAVREDVNSPVGEGFRIQLDAPSLRVSRIEGNGTTANGSPPRCRWDVGRSG